MPITITNRARHLALCTLNSGRTLHLAPAETSEPIDPIEINGNSKIDKLARAGLISIVNIDQQHPEQQDEPTPEETKPQATPSRRQRRERE